MEMAARVEGFKTCLNTTEFLLSSRSLSEIEKDLTKGGEEKSGRFTSAFIMVDPFRSDPEFAENIPFIFQKSYGIKETPHNQALRVSLDLPKITRGRFYHNHLIGGYTPGRHGSSYCINMTPLPDLAVLWYGYSPWTSQAIERKTRIGGTVSATDKSFGRGLHHVNSTIQNLESRWRLLQPVAASLFDTPFYQFHMSEFLRP
jgi:hypothetical protein